LANNKISKADDKDISRSNDKPDLTKGSDNSLLKDNLRNNIISTDQSWQSVGDPTTRKVWHITVSYHWNPPQLYIKELRERI
jgi:hypothetical protein